MGYSRQNENATKVMDNLCGSVAASCVVTYVLGIGDRHLENICLTPSGEFTSNLAMFYCPQVVDAIVGFLQSLSLSLYDYMELEPLHSIIITI